MKNNIFIPKKLKIGFNERKDTYTGQLGYIIYYDNKGVLRKEHSWENWRNKNIEPQEFDNVPTSGFVLNKKAGGYSTGWNHRQTYTRVYDPRNFEFEITIPNLLYILENTNSIKGKGLEGEFVYGFDGKDLILIPTSSPDYKELVEFNDNIHSNNTVKTKDLIVGATYQTKNNTSYVYMGKFDCYDYQYRTCESGEYKWYKKYSDLPTTERQGDRYIGRYIGIIDHEYKQTNCGKEFFFYTGNNFVHLKSISGLLISTIDDNCIDNYSDLFEKLEHYEYYSPIDDDKDVIIPYSLDEFIDIIKEYEEKSYYWYPEFYNKNKYRFEISCKNGKYKDNRSYRDEVYNLSIEDLFEKIQPVHLDKYLTNCKFYRREY